MKKFKVALVVLVISLVSNVLYVGASDTLSKVTSGDSVVFYVNEIGEITSESEITVEFLLSDMKTRGLYYCLGTVKIQNSGSKQVLISGSTTANLFANKLYLGLTLEKLVNGNWIYVSSVSFYAYNDCVVTGKEYYSVDAGYYYRVSGSFYVNHNGVTEYGAGSTDGILIN